MKKLLTILLFLFLVITAFGPYNLYYEFNEKQALHQFISEESTFHGLKIIEMDYRGSETYFIQAKDEEEIRNFIVMNYHSSVMNGHWKVFEQTSKGHYY
ncbi:hypothetical protein [Mesobacillus jeotgali]|uniref:hypothetical protein n=1 Tax=Mesobacillus jeotgali TaxID=129985 RepID=UPI001115DA66|nr:hypothetical protein [Mesobacillus jeotgali]